jgi:fibronectin-binding autotransporter adhesin
VGTGLNANFGFGSGTWTLSGALITLAGGPTAPVALQDSGKLVVNGGTLSGGGSSDIGFIVGATMTAQAAAKVSFQGTSLGSAAGDTGTLVVTGIGTSWQNTLSTGLKVGVAAATPTSAGGIGHVTITAAASMTDTGGDIVGVNAGSKGDISVTAGGTLTDNGLTIGQSGTGALTVSGVGSTVTTTGVSAIGSSAGGIGSATVSGGGVWTTTQGLTVGGFGSGTLAVGAGSSVGGGTVSVGSKGSINLAGGTLSSTSLTLSSLGTLSGSGTVLGSIIDNGTINATGGLLTLSGPVGGTGLLGIGLGATLDVNTTAASDTISFLGSTGTLVDHQVGTIGATVSGFVAGDTIDLSLLTFAPGATATIAGGVLTVKSGAAIETLRLTGIGNGSSFSVTADASGIGTLWRGD